MAAILLQLLAISIDNVIPFDLNNVSPGFTTWHKAFFRRVNVGLSFSGEEEAFESEFFSLGYLFFYFMICCLGFTFVNLCTLNHVRGNIWYSRDEEYSIYNISHSSTHPAYR